MTRRMVDIDDAKLDAARDALGTETIKDTVERALEEAVTARRDRQIRALEGLATFDFGPDPAGERDAAWGTDR